MIRAILTAAAVAAATPALSQSFPPVIEPVSCYPVSFMMENMAENGFVAIALHIGMDGFGYINYVRDDGAWMFHITDGSVECHIAGGDYIELLFKEGDPA